MRILINGEWHNSDHIRAGQENPDQPMFFGIGPDSRSDELRVIKDSLPDYGVEQ